VLSILVGAVLLVAGALKAIDFRNGIGEDSSIGASRPLLIALIESELVLAGWLISGWKARAAHTMGTVAFALFFGAAVYKWVGGEETCGCFGAVRLDPRYAAAFDVFAVLGLAWFRPSRTGSRGGRIWRGAVGTVTGASVTISAAAMALFTPAELVGSHIVGDSDHVLVRTADWVGAPLPLLPWIDCQDRLTTGEWVAVFYHHECGACRRVVPQFEALAEEIGAASGGGAPFCPNRGGDASTRDRNCPARGIAARSACSSESVVDAASYRGPPEEWSGYRLHGNSRGIDRMALAKGTQSCDLGRRVSQFRIRAAAPIIARNCMRSVVSD